MTDDQPLPQLQRLAAAIGWELSAAAPQGWIHLRANFSASGRGEAFAVTDQGSHWIAVADPVRKLVLEHRAAVGPWTTLKVDVSPGQPAVMQVEWRQAAPSGWVRRSVIMISAVCMLAALIVALVTAFRSSPAEIPIDVAPPPSAAQLEAQRLVESWYDNEKGQDPAWLRQLVCADPTGLVAEDLALAEAGPSSRNAQIRVEGFTDFVDNGATAQIRVYYTGHPLSADVAKQVENRREGYFIWTYVFVREHGELRICGG